MPLLENNFMLIATDVAEIDVPLLLILDIFSERWGLLIFKNDVIESKADGWTVSPIRRNGHLYILWELSILHTERSCRTPPSLPPSNIYKGIFFAKKGIPYESLAKYTNRDGKDQRHQWRLAAKVWSSTLVLSITSRRRFRIQPYKLAWSHIHLP